MRPLVVALAAAALAACGSPPGDLLALGMSGGPGAVHQTLVVTNDGRASCNRGLPREISSAQLLDARSIVREAKPLAKRSASYPAGRAGGRSFVLRSQDGIARWSETSAGLPPPLTRAELFALKLAPSICR